MKLKVCAVMDLKVGLFSQPSMFRTIGEAERSFRSACTNQKSNFVQYPEDYIFYQIAEFNEETGEFENNKPLQILSAIQAVSMEKERNFKLEQESDGK